MSSVIDDLLALQGHDDKIKRFQRQAKDIPARKGQEQQRLANAAKALEQARTAVATANAQLESNRIDIERLTAALVEFRSKINSLRSNKEFAAMNAQIRAAENDLSGCRERETSLKDDLETCMSEVGERQAIHDSVKVEVEAVCKDLDERMARVDEEMRKLAEEREPFLKPFKEDPERVAFLRYYEGFSRQRWPVLSLVADGICSQCRMHLPPSKLQAAKRGTELVKCDYCGRLIH